MEPKDDDISVLEWCIRLTYTGQTVAMIRHRMLLRQAEMKAALDRKKSEAERLAEIDQLVRTDLN